jgi:hypothetical protein
MNEEQITIIDREIYRLKAIADKLERTPKRGQQFNHSEEIARTYGEILGLKKAKLLLQPVDPNLIEQ